MEFHGTICTFIIKHAMNGSLHNNNNNNNNCLNSITTREKNHLLIRYKE